MFTDTHTHLYDRSFGNECAEAVRRALAAGVQRMILPNVDLNTIEPMKALANLFPENLWCAMGIHPTDIDSEKWEEQLDIVHSELRLGKYIAVGEVGMDLYWEKEREILQMECFERQCSFAREFSLPVIIHCREALPQTLEVLSGFKDLRAVFHCFGGTQEDVRNIRQILPEAFFGINGIVTFKNSGLTTVLPAIGQEKIVLETDSPYLAPVPYRGKRNESSYLPIIAKSVGDSLGMSVESIEHETTLNAEILFSFNHK